MEAEEPKQGAPLTPIKVGGMTIYPKFVPDGEGGWMPADPKFFRRLVEESLRESKDKE